MIECRKVSILYCLFIAKCCPGIVHMKGQGFTNATLAITGYLINGCCCVVCNIVTYDTNDTIAYPLLIELYVFMSAATKLYADGTDGRENSPQACGQSPNGACAGGGPVPLSMDERTRRKRGLSQRHRQTGRDRVHSAGEKYTSVIAVSRTALRYVRLTGPMARVITDHDRQTAENLPL